MHGRFDNLQKRHRYRLVEYVDIVDNTERGKNAGPLLLGDNRPVGILVLFDGAVGVQTDNQDITLTPGFPQKAEMSEMEQVETAVAGNN